METILLIGRVLFGGFFLFMGILHFKNLKMMTSYAHLKGVKLPAFAVIVSGLMIIVGGLGVILGIYLNISFVLIAIFLFFVTIKVHKFWNETDLAIKKTETTNFLKNVALFGATILLYAISFNFAS